LKDNYKILIPGGTGFIGHHLCLFFVKKKWKVFSITKSKPKKNRKIKGVKYIYCDVNNKKNLKKKLDDYYDYIVNLSGYVDHSKNQSITKTHYQGCKNLVNNFKQKRPKKFIQIGSSIEYGKQESPQKEILLKKIDTSSFYGNAKLASTFFLLSLFKKESYPISIIRPYLVYGPNQDNNRVIPFVINNSLEGNIFNCSPGNQFRDFLYIDDFVKAVYRSLKSTKNSGEVINIGSGKPVKIKSLILKIKNLVGKGKPKFCKIQIRSDEPVKLYPDILKAKKLLNWKPKITLEQGLNRTINFYKKNAKKS
jgi:nucleoside-diphosphate-sugar epimerase